MWNNTKKLKLLLWKNLLIQKRHPIQSIIEVLMPAIMACILVMFRSWVQPIEFNEPTKFPPFPIIQPPVLYMKNYTLAWGPYHPKLNDIMVAAFNDFPNLKLRSFKYVDYMEKNLNKNNAMKYYLAGVRFDNVSPNNTELPKNIAVKFRFPCHLRATNKSYMSFDTVEANWRTYLIFPLYQTFGPRHKEKDDGGEPGYSSESFLYLQNRISREIVRYWTPNAIFPEVIMQRFPYPKYIEDPLLPALTSFVSTVVLLSYVYTAINTIKVIAAEKESKMKEAMMLMGLDNWLHAMAWYLKSFIIWIIPLLILVFFITFEWPTGAVFQYSDPFVLMAILTLYVTSGISYCFLIATLFKKANTAATVGGVLWFGSYAPFMIFQPKYSSMTNREILVSTLLPNTALGYIFQSLIMFEGIGKGLTWDNISITVSPDDKLSIADIMCMLALDTVMFLVVAIYLETAFPKNCGFRPPWYFPIMPSFWFGQKVSSNATISEKSGIQINSLTKWFSHGKPVVNNLTLDMYPNQITVLLGHNGAGKSTTMSMLTGLLRPSAGSALIEGYDINTQMKKIRNSLGLCPQYNVLIPDLTVKEHLLFFGVLKNLDSEMLKDEVAKYTEKFELEPMLNTKSKHLSGGMKRKLSVAVALIGKSKVVLMDEPTSGMDPAARRTLWNILQSEREGRTMVMTTHLMDEADLLGDRVAIMKAGKLCCVGTPFSLKKEYGGGYTLTLVKDTVKCSVSKLTNFIRKFYPHNVPSSITIMEVVYKLEDSSFLPELLNSLEQNKSSLGIKEYGITLTSLQDVFMRVGQDENKKLSDFQINSMKHKSIDSKSRFDHFFYDSGSDLTDMKSQRATGWKLFIIQAGAIMEKKCLQSYRSLVLHSLQIGLTVFFICLAFLVVNAWQGMKDLPAMIMSLGTYWEPISTIMLVSDNGDNNLSIYESYKKACGSNPVHDLHTHKYDYFENHLLKVATKNIAPFTQKYIIGAVFNNNTITAFFNNQPYHGPPLSLNMVYNAILKSFKGEDYGIDIINHPLPYQREDKLLKLTGGSNLGYQIAFNCGISQAFVCAVYVLFAVKERQSGAKHMQQIAGIKPLAYWGASLLWDWISYLTIIFSIMGLLYLYNDPGYSSIKQMGLVLSLLVAFSWATLPLMGLFSYMFTNPSTSFTRMSVFSVLTGSMIFMLVLILDMQPLSLKDQADAIDSIMIYFPHYALSSGLRNIYLAYEYNDICDFNKNDTCKGWDGDNLSWNSPGIGRNMVHLFWLGCVCVSLLLSCEYLAYYGNKIHCTLLKLYSYLWKKALNEDKFDLNYYESDVAQEKQVVSNTDPRNFCLYLKNVWKNYGNKQAVKGINLALKPNECFGLLGSNGAGKTTTFRMLTGDIKNTSGDIYVCGIHVNNNREKIHEVGGYCPQFNGLIEELTGFETLYFFCRLRGMSNKEATTMSFHLASRLAFMPYLNRQAKTYSGGNKRKLSTAIAMIGDPSVLFLDEPTSGMDPAARKHLWDTVSEERDRGKCVFITSHSLEECEALCTRLAVMVDGRICCIGSVQHLKNKFSVGYQLHVKFHPDNYTKAKEFVLTSFSGATLREEFEITALFHIPKKYPCSYAFAKMEQAKKELLIDDYSITQTSLEQVFLNFTRNRNQIV
ncbi:phospholipid-transporting ATPase ABCA1-like [Daktulosphaira vitifoliae]|uniref:phospholipid-transporting ATPase ABCA1-like n=1 Tax=Daktulosphaira vitifoliae TaxID=58002 RepID=UPI0021AA92DA|nr:phospholipid-transporting ATPase ABCA1-like [Daktulosphaira vitifoliae]